VIALALFLALSDGVFIPHDSCARFDQSVPGVDPGAIVKVLTAAELGLVWRGRVDKSGVVTFTACNFDSLGISIYPGYRFDFDVQWSGTTFHASYVLPKREEK
jgi:hypothetical protein